MFPRAWNIWFVTTLFVAFQLFIGMLFGLSVNELSKSLSITESGVSNIVSVYFLAYAIMQIPAGFLIDKLKSIKLTLIIVAVLMVISLLMLGATNSLVVAIIAAVIMGFASSFNFVAAVILIGRWFPEKMFSVAVGMTSGLNGLFASFMGYIVLYLAPLFNINEIYITALLGIIISVLILFVVKDYPAGKTVRKYDSNIEFNLFDAIKSAVLNKQILLASFMTALIYGSMLAFLTFWNIQYQKLYGLDMKTISILNIVALTGIAIGAPTLGFISEKIGKRKPVAAGISICLFFMLLIILQPVDLSVPVLFAVMFLLGFFANNVSIGFAIVKDNAIPEFIGTSIAFANTILFLSLSAFQFFPGKISGLVKFTDNIFVKHYASNEVAVMSITFSLYIFAVIVAFVLLLFIKEKEAIK